MQILSEIIILKPLNIEFTQFMNTRDIQILAFILWKHTRENIYCVHVSSQNDWTLSTPPSPYLTSQRYNIYNLFLLAANV